MRNVLQQWEGGCDGQWVDLDREPTDEELQAAGEGWGGQFRLTPFGEVRTIPTSPCTLMRVVIRLDSLVSRYGAG